MTPDQHPLRHAPTDPTLPEEFLQSVRAWQDSRIVLTAVELDVFSAVRDGATSPEVARQLRLDGRAVDILLHALTALGLLEKQGEVFRNGPLADRHLRADAPDDLRAALRHSAALWHRWSRLSEVVRTGQPAPREEHDPDDTESFVAAMHMNASARAPRMVAALDLSGARRALDLGGGSGAHAIALARAVPGLRVEVVDVPDVLPLTRRYIAEAGLEDRVFAREGDLRAGEYGEGYDLALLSAVCHMLGRDENADLIRRAARALGPQGQLVVHDHILDPDRASPRAAAVFAVNMLVNTRAGASYAEADYVAWMRAAGLADVRRVALDGPTALIVGRRS
jgi:predicted O-methyltransferase YrrM/DNA-binding CsgD family transcriptional regulator